MEEPTPEIWLAEPPPEIGVILTATETGAILAGQVRQLRAGMHKSLNPRAEDSQQQPQLIEIVPAGMLQLLPEKGVAEPIRLVVLTETDQNTAIRNTRIAREIHRKLVIPVLQAEIQEIRCNPTGALLQESQIIKDLQLPKADRTIKGRLVHRVRADSIINLRKLILVLPIQTEVQVLRTDPILHQLGLILPDPIQLQAEAIAIPHQEVAAGVPEVPVELAEVEEEVPGVPVAEDDNP